MTTYYDFIPSNKSAPNFMPTFDGVQYTVAVIWNVSARRYYIKCMSLNSVLKFLVPLVESNSPIEIIGYTWDRLNGRVIVTLVAPHGMPIGQVINVNIVGTVHTKYNGSGLGSVLSKTEIMYPMQNNPGQVTILGVLDMFISMTKGYFNSTLVYRNNRFEVTP